MADTAHAMGNCSATDMKSECRMPTPGDTLIVGDFRIDVEERTVFLRNKKLELATAEFNLLVYLVSHPKRMVTGQTMLSTHWGDDRVHQTQFLQVLLSLRRKLEAAAAGTHYIRTEPLIVYRFDPVGE